MPFSPISIQRLHNQQINHSKLKRPEQVLSWLGAIQGQDYTGAKWSIGLRLPNATDIDIEHAFANKKILRTWLMRGTLHIVSAEDIEWMRALVAPKIIKGNARRYKELELDEPTLFKSSDFIVKVLQDKKTVNRSELLAALEKNGISTKGQRAAYMLQRASYDGLVCQINSVRSSANYILMEKSVTGGINLDRHEAVAELTKRYFRSRGPATIQDFVWWSGLTVAEAKAGLEVNKSLFCQEIIEGQTYWLPNESQTLKSGNHSTFFLPGFDEFLLAYKVRSASLDPKYSNNWCPGNNGMFFPFIVVDGQVTGIWKRAFKKNAVIIEITSFDIHKQMDVNSINTAIKKFCRFIDMEPLIRIN